MNSWTVRPMRLVGISKGENEKREEEERKR